MMVSRLRQSVSTGSWVLCALLVTACTESRSDSPAAPSPARELLYTAIGASDAIGIGASAPCLPFVACPDGTGYVHVIARALATGRTVSLNNLGIPGAVLGPEVQALGNQYGRGIPANFLEREVPFVTTGSDVVTAFAGGNDVNTIAAAIERGAAGPDVGGYIDAQILAFARDYDALVRGVRQRAPSARLVVANLPNLAGLPYAAGYSLPQKQVLQRLAVGFSVEVINRLTSQNVGVVDLLCDGRAYEASRYSSDGYHPNDAGYRLLADEMIVAIESPSYRAPQPSCPQTAIVPAP